MLLEDTYMVLECHAWRNVLDGKGELLI